MVPGVWEWRALAPSSSLIPLPQGFVPETKQSVISKKGTNVRRTDIAQRRRSVVSLTVERNV